MSWHRRKSIHKVEVENAMLTKQVAKADQAIAAHLEANPAVDKLRLRLVLEDLTDYGDQPPVVPLTVVVEGEVAQPAE